MREDRFFAELFPRLGEFPEDLAVSPGDDCAAIRVGPGRLWLVAVDQVVGGRHYFLDGPRAVAPERVGRKLLGRNLSDIAAMGGVPRFALTAAGMGPGQDPEWMQRFFDGIIETGREFGVSMIGGDLAGTPNDAVAALTILGEVGEAEVCRRSGARPGDCLFVTGVFGASLETEWHLDFQPRCREGRWLARSGAVRAMIDVSDGLFLDLERLCRASNVRAAIDPARIPTRVPGLDWRRAGADGEDYELLFAVSPEAAARLPRDWPFPETPLTRIGECVNADSAGSHPALAGTAGAWVLGPDGRPLLPAEGGPAGYDHFRTIEP